MLVPKRWVSRREVLDTLRYDSERQACRCEQSQQQLHIHLPVPGLESGYRCLIQAYRRSQSLLRQSSSRTPISDESAQSAIKVHTPKLPVAAGCSLAILVISACLMDSEGGS